MGRLALALLIAVAGCSDIFGPGSKLTELDAARDKWHRQGLHDYRFTLRAICFCAYTNPLTVTVIHDSVATVVDQKTNQPIDRSVGQTIDGLFGFVERAIREKAQMIDVQYDPARGYPASINYDGSYNVADDEVTYVVSDVVPLATMSSATSSPELFRTAISLISLIHLIEHNCALSGRSGQSG